MYGKGWGETLEGILMVAGAMATPFLRKSRLQWGATEEEMDQEYQGDEYVPVPKWGATHAISIQASPEDIWPWLVQIGQEKGGFYSYEKLENFAGCGIQNATEVLESYQSIQAGDLVKLHKETPPMKVALADPCHTLLLEGNPAYTEGEVSENAIDMKTTWGFYLKAQDKFTRLISRTRYDYPRGLGSALMGGPHLIEPISFVMERKMLKVIKQLVESDSTAP